MIEIHISGGLGVRLFQYMFGVILSELKQDSLTVVESIDYQKDYELTKKRKYYGFESLLTIFPNIKKNIVQKYNYLDNPKVISGHIHNVSELVDYKGKIILKGSGFQRYEYYQNFPQIIKKYLTLKHQENSPISLKPNDVVIHYRLGDTCYEKLKKKVRKSEKYLGYHECQNMTPEYFIDILKSQKFSDIYLITDEPNHVNINKLKNMFPIQIINQNQYDDFLLLTRAPNLIICHSTFSWWAAYLSQSQKIYMPKTHHHPDIKYHAEWIYRDDICLDVNDQNRYHYL